MTNRNRNKRRPSRLDRIERKCDIILSELLIIRQRLNRSEDLDATIERLHRSARTMRAQAAKERENARRMLNLKYPE